MSSVPELLSTPPDEAAFEPEWSVSEVDAAEWMAEAVSPFAALDELEAERETPVLRRGSRGAEVRALQRALAAAGHPVTVDGDFGARTEAAVRAFQSASGLVVDGVVGARTWRQLTGGGGTSGSSAGPDTPLGTLVLHAPGREFSYRFTSDDLVWTAKLLVHEAGGEDDAENAAVLWAMFNRYALFTHRVFATFGDFIRAYSTTLQPVLRSAGAAARHMHRPPDEFIRTGGNYPGTDIPKGQLKRHLDIQRAPWHAVKASARALATRALTGSLPNPGIGLASEFASTRIYFKQRHRREPTREEWRRFTIELAKRKRWRWIGEVPGLNQLENAFFLDLRAADLPDDAIRVQALASGGELEATDVDVFERGEWELDERNLEEGEPLDEAWSPEQGEDEAHEFAEAEEYIAHADFEDADDDFEAPDESVTPEIASDGAFSVENELADFASFLADLPERVRTALRQGYAQVAVRLMVAAGVRDENRLSNIVFHSRHPELNGRPIRTGERTLAAEWLAIRNDLVRPLLQDAAAGPSPQPARHTQARPSRGPLGSGRMRSSWRADECRDDAMVWIEILGRRTPANARTAEAWAALDAALRRTGYRAERAWVYNCRDIKGTKSRSLHAYGLAVDIDPRWNPNRRTPDERKVLFSTSPTQEERLADVRRGVADTVFTEEQVKAVEAIRTIDGYQVFMWGGRWKTIKDTMHFQLGVTPAELARGLAT